MDSDKARVCVLYDIYGELLPSSVSDFIDLYYNNDLSLSEIAENTGISRQGVRDGLVRGCRLLNEYESKLGLYEKYKENNDTVSEIKSEILSLDMKEDKKDKIINLIGKLVF